MSDFLILSHAGMSGWALCGPKWLNEHENLTVCTSLTQLSCTTWHVTQADSWRSHSYLDQILL